ncbi:hypothetical protein BsWGS_08280 [Bradybaena similaris]
MSTYITLVVFIIHSCIFHYGIADNHEDSATGGIISGSLPADFPAIDGSAHRNDDVLVQLEDAEVDVQVTSTTSTEDPETELTFEKLYALGVKAYDQHSWYLCADSIEKAVKGYREYKKTLLTCRHDCSKGIRSSKLSNLSSSITDFSHFTKLLRDADCFRRCKDEILIQRPTLPEKLEESFENRDPYQYLQYCYFKLDRLKQAASAAYTYFLANPDDVDTRHNIEYYRNKASVEDTDFLDLELVPYKDHYIRAMHAYTDQDWKSVITELENCLKEYFKEHNGCLVNCVARVKPKGREFITGVADMFISGLFCKLNCEEKLSVVYTEPIVRFLQDIYHYLQFAFYQEGNLEKAAEATASFLVLNSSHEVMKDNKDILKTQLNYSDDDFIPQEDVKEYACMRKEMLDLMDFLNKHYRWPGENNVTDEETERVDQEDTDDWMTKYEKLGTHIIAKSVDLNREGRFVTDGMLKDEQCEQLLTLTKDLAVEKVGSQKFDLRIAKQKLEETLDEGYEASLRLFYRAAEIVSQYTQRYIGADKPFYLKNASIVCWSQPQDANDVQGCYAQETGTCVRFDEMCGELDINAFTTVTGLSSAEGDFQFLNERQEVDSSFGVKCGRTVGFNTGDCHTVKVPQNKDERICSLVIRFTADQGVEKDYRDTLVLLHSVDSLRFTRGMQLGNNILKKFEEEGVKIVKNGEKLMGKERFVADGLASEAQCTTLKNMVQITAALQEGSSATSFISPHTEHETLIEITIYSASKLTHIGKISTFGLRTFLELSENSRLLVERYFNLTKPLYFDYTHLVCRTAVDDSNTNREDLSHPVHADNCVLQPDGSCTKEFPAFSHRDYSAILYLNADFEGGEFFFAHANKTEQVSLRPKCGRLVGFSAGEFHGVKAVKSGQRCALALWFTTDPSYKEIAHIQALRVLKRLEDEQKAQEKIVHEDL